MVVITFPDSETQKKGLGFLSRAGFGEGFEKR